MRLRLVFKNVLILFALRGLSVTNIPYQADLLNKHTGESKYYLSKLHRLLVGY